MTSTTMQIECPACAGQGGAGTYCEDCDCTGMVYVPECVADELATVRKLADMAQAALAAMTQRAEDAELKLASALGADKPDKPATPTERARLFAMVAAEQRRRAEQAEAALADMTLYASYCGIEALNDYPCHVLDLDEWQATPHCPECGAIELYEMTDRAGWWCSEQHTFIAPACKEVQP